MRTLLYGLLFSLFVVSAVQAQVTSVTPTSGPASGGTRVTLKGDFAALPYGVIFGGVEVAAERVDEHTLAATTPPHLPGTSPIVLFEYDFGISTNFKFTFEGPVPEQFERLLLPVLVPPAKGAFGSEFHTKLRFAPKQQRSARIFGLRPSYCLIESCHWEDTNDAYLSLYRPSGSTPGELVYSGTPGRFVYVPKDELAAFSANLRVRDVTRSAFNYGTEVPIVRSSEFATRIMLQAVPTDPRFRSSVRIYAAERTEVTISVEGRQPVRLLLDEAADLFDPAYASFSDFPIGTETVNVTIDATIPIWAIGSVTNNDTQLITTITPQF